MRRDRYLIWGRSSTRMHNFWYSCGARGRIGLALHVIFVTFQKNKADELPHDFLGATTLYTLKNMATVAGTELAGNAR